MEPLGANRFGPLEKIKEFAAKKTTNSKGNNQPKSNVNTNTNNNINNNLSNRNKTLQANLSGPTIQTGKVSTQSTLDSNPKNVLNSKTNLPLNSKASNEDRQNVEVASPLKLEFTIDQTSLHKGSSSKYSNDSSRNENIDGGNKSGHFNFRILSNSSVSSKKPQQQQQQSQPQQSKNVKGYNPGSNFNSPQQSNPVGSNSTVASSNQSQLLSQAAPVVTSFISNGSAINLRPAYPGIRMEEQPKKKVVYVPPPQSNKYKVFVHPLVIIIKF